MYGVALGWPGGCRCDRELACPTSNRIRLAEAESGPATRRDPGRPSSAPSADAGCASFGAVGVGVVTFASFCVSKVGDVVMMGGAMDCDSQSQPCPSPKTASATTNGIIPGCKGIAFDLLSPAASSFALADSCVSDANLKRARPRNP